MTQAPTISQRHSPTAVSFLLLLLALISLFKGFSKHVSVWGEPYWLINYNDGLIRRGLLGHLFSLLYDHKDMPRVHAAILGFHWTACFLLIVSIWEWARSLTGNTTILALFAVFAASQFLPTTAYQTGFSGPLCLFASVGRHRRLDEETFRSCDSNCLHRAVRSREVSHSLDYACLLDALAEQF